MSFPAWDEDEDKSIGPLQSRQRYSKAFVGRGFPACNSSLKGWQLLRARLMQNLDCHNRGWGRS